MYNEKKCEKLVGWKGVQDTSLEKDMGKGRIFPIPIQSVSSLAS